MSRYRVAIIAAVIGILSLLVATFYTSFSLEEKQQTASTSGANRK